MRRRATVALILFPVAFGGCVTAKQKREEQQELARSIVRTSSAETVQGCAFIMNLRPEERYGSAEAQTESLVIPKAGIEWVILETPGGNQLYSCKAIPDEPKPAEAAKSPEPAKAAGAPTPASGPASASMEAATPAPSPVRPGSSGSTGAPAPASAAAPRVTNNSEAVRGCRFLASFTEYQAVSLFQEAVARTGGDVAYVVASNRDGEVVGESYRCGGP